MTIKEARDLASLVGRYNELEKFIEELENSDTVYLQIGSSEGYLDNFTVYKGMSPKLYGDIHLVFNKALRSLEDEIIEEY